MLQTERSGPWNVDRKGNLVVLLLAGLEVPVPMLGTQLSPSGLVPRM